MTRLEATESLNILQQQYKIIQHLENNKEIKELWEIPKFLTNEEITEINDVLDPKYWDNNDNIIEKMFNIYSEFLDNTKKNKYDTQQNCMALFNRILSGL